VSFGSFVKSQSTSSARVNPEQLVSVVTTRNPITPSGVVFWGELAEVKACDEPRDLRLTVVYDIVTAKN
jgi:hypothetical protein